jgi:PAS domain S-box-containing protein
LGVNWHAVALHFAERSSACALLDQASSIRLFSSGLERLLGWNREEVEGRKWSDAVVPREFAATAQARLERALSGMLRSFDCDVTTSRNERYKISFETVLVGRDDMQGLLLTVTDVHLVADEELGRTDDIDYEIDSSLSDFGRLLKIKTASSPPRTVFSPSDRCYNVIGKRRGPCEDCPILQNPAGHWPRTTARRRSDDERAYEVLTAETTDDRVRVRLRRISEETLAAIYESKVRALADAAQLSERERSVLTYLLMGRSLGDIALILGISPRTVKFHQANVLEKLGADSRADLVRLIT